MDTPGRRDGDRDLRHVGARQHCRPRQCRGQLCRAEAVGRAQQGQRHRHPLDRRASAEGARTARRTAGCSCWRRRRSRASAMPAGFRCSSRCWAATSTTRSSTTSRSRSSSRPAPIRSLQHVLTTFRPGAPHVAVTVDRDAGADAAGFGRRRVLGADRLSRLDLRQPVQQVRPVVAGLCAGRFAIPPAARRSAQPLCAQPGRQHGADRRGRPSRARRSDRRWSRSTTCYPSATIIGARRAASARASR